MKLPDGNKEIRPLSASFTISDALSSFLRKINVKGEQSDACGLFGYTTFNCVKYTENIPVREKQGRTQRCSRYAVYSLSLHADFSITLRTKLPLLSFLAMEKKVGYRV